MQIVLNTHCDSETPPPEYFIIELQGTLEYTSSYHKQEYGAKKQQRIVSLNGLKIGEFDLDLNDKATLKISHHTLTGRKVMLDQPVAIIQPCPLDTTKMRENEDAPQQLVEEVEVVGIIRYKYLFNQRPEFMVGQENRDFNQIQ